MASIHDPAVAQLFLSAWPRYDRQRQVKSLSTARELLAEKIEQRMEGGKFDPSRLPERDRLPVARRYIELRQRLSDLDRHIEDLEHAGEFEKQWATRL